VLVAERALLYASIFDLATCTVHGCRCRWPSEAGWADERELIPLQPGTVERQVSALALPTFIVMCLLKVISRD
jgi:hypothetical protein